MLSAKDNCQLWISEGFAHGLIVLSDTAEFLYKTTDYYAPKFERCIAWNEPAIAIQWPNDIEPVLSANDQQGKSIAYTEHFP